MLCSCNKRAASILFMPSSCFLLCPFPRFPASIYICDPFASSSSYPSTCFLLFSTKLREFGQRKMIKLRSMRFSRSSFKLSSGNREAPSEKDCSRNMSEIKWELRPGGMLVQKRDTSQNSGEGLITIRVSTVSHCHDISIEATSTFGELKMVMSLITNMEPREQRVLFKGKERDDEEYLHMVGVRDKDKVLLLQDPAIKEEEEKRKLLGLATGRSQPIDTPCRTISV